MSKKIQNIYELYIENGCRFGFYVTRDSWSKEKYAEVIGIDGVKDGEMIEGTPPYFNRSYPEGHPCAGKNWQRGITLRTSWTDTEFYESTTGGTYVWTRVYPDQKYGKPGMLF